MARKRLGRRERALVKAYRTYRAEHTGIVVAPFAIGKRRTMWDNHGVPFAKPKSRPWEYDWKLGRKRHPVKVSKYSAEEDAKIAEDNLLSAMGYNLFV